MKEARTLYWAYIAGLLALVLIAYVCSQRPLTPPATVVGTVQDKQEFEADYEYGDPPHGSMSSSCWLRIDNHWYEVGCVQHDVIRIGQHVRIAYKSKLGGKE
jgi:hypothetical protein